MICQHTHTHRTPSSPSTSVSLSHSPPPSFCFSGWESSSRSAIFVAFNWLLSWRASSLISERSWISSPHSAIFMRPTGCWDAWSTLQRGGGGGGGRGRYEWSEAKQTTGGRRQHERANRARSSCDRNITWESLRLSMPANDNTGKRGWKPAWAIKKYPSSDSWQPERRCDAPLTVLLRKTSQCDQSQESLSRFIDV